MKTLLPVCAVALSLSGCAAMLTPGCSDGDVVTLLQEIIRKDFDTPVVRIVDGPDFAGPIKITNIRTVGQDDYTKAYTCRCMVVMDRTSGRTAEGALEFTVDYSVTLLDNKTEFWVEAWVPD